MPRQLWIADRCRQSGLKVVEVDGWRTRGADTFSPRGVVCHHTANGPGEIGSLRVLINGRSDLPGPLCNVGLGRSGTVYVIASGRANHAGSGGYKGLTGNSSVLGIEAENRGTSADPWPAEQLKAYHRLCAALITGPGVGGAVALVCGHKEWTTRKVDPHSLDMNAFRTEVKRIVDGQEDELTPEQEAKLDKLIKYIEGKNGNYGTNKTVFDLLIESTGEGYVDGQKQIRTELRDLVTALRAKGVID